MTPAANVQTREKGGHMSVGFIPRNDNFPHEPVELSVLTGAYLALLKDVRRYAMLLELLDPVNREIAHVMLALNDAEGSHGRLGTLLAEVDRLKRAVAEAKRQSITPAQPASMRILRALLGGGLLSALLFGLGVATGVIIGARVL
jgi:hypothetical protein